jgi:hypothetical protein
MTARQAELFARPPRQRPRVMMHVVDAGNAAGAGKIIIFVCRSCGYSTNWIEDTKTVSENKRGMPCPQCNRGENDEQI